MEIITDGKRYNTDRLEQLIDEQPTQHHASGITLLGAWKTRDGRVLVVTDSVWCGNNDECTGITGHFADEGEVTSLAKRYGGPIGNLVPESEY